MLNKWLARLKQWVEIFFGSKKQYAPPVMIERWESESGVCSVIQMERHTPGAIATYRIISKFPEHHYLITLDYLPDFFAELQLEKKLTAKYRTPFSLRQKSLNSCSTHRFAISQILLNGGTRPIKIWDVNLDPMGVNYNLVKSAPLKAIRGVAWRQLITPDPNIPWEVQIQHMDWLGLLESRIRGELSNKNHDLKAVLVFPKPEEV